MKLLTVVPSNGGPSPLSLVVIMMNGLQPSFLETLEVLLVEEAIPTCGRSFISTNLTLSSSERHRHHFLRLIIFGIGKALRRLLSGRRRVMQVASGPCEI